MQNPLSVNEHLNTLQTFRQTVYASALGPARDAVFELTDAVLLAPALNSFAELSLSPIFRRRWPMLYEALQDGRPDRYTLLDLYIAQMPCTPTPVVGRDHTARSRLSAYTLRHRTIEQSADESTWGETHHRRTRFLYGGLGTRKPRELGAATVA